MSANQTIGFSKTAKNGVKIKLFRPYYLQFANNMHKFSFFFSKGDGRFRKTNYHFEMRKKSLFYAKERNIFQVCWWPTVLCTTTINSKMADIYYSNSKHINWIAFHLLKWGMGMLVVVEVTVLPTLKFWKNVGDLL